MLLQINSLLREMGHKEDKGKSMDALYVFQYAIKNQVFTTAVIELRLSEGIRKVSK